MTLPSTTPKEIKLGNDATTVWSFGFIINKADDLTVTHTDANGIETVVTEGSGTGNYSLSVTNYPGIGSITYPATLGTELPTGEKLTLQRVVEIDQETDLKNHGAWDPEQVESAFDYSRMIDLQLEEQVDRSLKVPVSDDSGADFTVPAMGAGAADLVLGVASDGLSYALKTLASIGAVVVSNLAPLVSGTAAAGTSGEVSRADHVHPSAKDVTEELTGKTINSLLNFVHADATHIKVRNVSGVTMTKGQVVYESGWNAGQAASEVLLADADDPAKMPGLGIVDEDIANNANGHVIALGALVGDATFNLDTSAWSDGDDLYIHTVAGELTDVEPSSNAQPIAKVLRSHASLGVLHVDGPGAPFPSAVSGAMGQCILEYTSATVLTLNPKDGEHLTINGSAVNIGGSPTLANTGLVAATVYYVYCSDTPTLSASTTVPVIHTDGTMVKTGDTTLALVGMIYTGAGSPGVFADSPTQRFVWSHFNGKPLVGYATRTAGSVNTASPTLVDLTDMQVEMVTPANTYLDYTFVCTFLGTGTDDHTFNIDIDGTDYFGNFGVTDKQTVASKDAQMGIAGVSVSLAAGLHTIKVQWFVATGTGTVRATSNNIPMLTVKEIR